MARASIIELFSRAITIVDRKTKVWSNGDDDLYPSRIRLVKQNSVTATSACQIMSQFILGSGPSVDYIVNKRKNYSLYDIAEMVADDLAEQKGCFIHVNYDIEGIPNYIDVLDYSKCRIAKEDDLGYRGCIYYYPDLNKRKEFKKFYPFNSDKKIILEQRRRDAGKSDDLTDLVSRYRGQVYFLNLEPNKEYPLSFLDPVYNDADSEFRISEFKNSSARKGFIGKVIATVLKTDDQVEARKMDTALLKMLGTDNTGNLLKLETELDADGKLSPVIMFETIASNIDDKMFAHTEESITKSILTAFNNVPKQLVMSADSSLFGASGDSIRAMQEFYQYQTRNERKKMESALRRITGNADLTIVPLIQKDGVEVTDKVADAQAQLKGSVGGVQGILSIQEKVSQGISDRDSAIAILEEVFGFETDKASRIVGTPESEADRIVKIEEATT